MITLTGRERNNNTNAATNRPIRKEDMIREREEMRSKVVDYVFPKIKYLGAEQLTQLNSAHKSDPYIFFLTGLHAAGMELELIEDQKLIWDRNIGLVNSAIVSKRNTQIAALKNSYIGTSVMAV